MKFWYWKGGTNWFRSAELREMVANASRHIDFAHCKQRKHCFDFSVVFQWLASLFQPFHHGQRATKNRTRNLILFVSAGFRFLAPPLRFASKLTDFWLSQKSNKNVTEFVQDVSKSNQYWSWFMMNKMSTHWQISLLQKSDHNVELMKP